MESRLKQVFSNVFLININEITDETSQKSLESWDSIGHLNLITSIEEEFEILFTEEQIIKMLNYNFVYIITKEAIDGKK